MATYWIEDSESGLVWDAPGRDSEGLVLGEETEKVRKLERRIYRGAVGKKKVCVYLKEVAVQGESMVALSPGHLPVGSFWGRGQSYCPAQAQEAEQVVQKCET